MTALCFRCVKNPVPRGVATCDPCMDEIYRERPWADPRADQPPPHTGLIDRHGRMDCPMMDRFERRMRFLQAAKPREAPYMDRDGEWGIYAMATDAMCLITGLENTIAAMAQQPIHADEIDRLIEAARDAEAQVHWGNAGTRKRANAELEAARATLLVSDRSGVERDKHALRWIFEHGLKHSTERPDFVNEALSDAMEPARAALNPIPEKDEQ